MPVIVYPVKDLDRAKKLYATFLGVEPYADSPYYVGFRIGDMEYGLDPNGHSKGLTGPVAYADVDDAAESLRRLVAAGATVLQPPSEVAPGLTVAIAADADGNALGLRSAVATQSA